MSHSHPRRPSVRREAFAAILEREMGKRASLNAFANEIETSGAMSAEAVKRRVYTILNPECMDSRSGRKYIQKFVDFNTVDKILTGLELNYLLHTELADAIVFPRCPGCGCPPDERTVGCQPCSGRFWRRNTRRTTTRKEAA